jgi:hypothetical protein
VADGLSPRDSHGSIVFGFNLLQDGRNVVVADPVAEP